MRDTSSDVESVSQPQHLVNDGATVTALPTTTVPSVPGSTPMEQKKNLEESGLPAPTPAPVTHGGEQEPDGEFISEEQLRAMDHVQLAEIYVKAGVALPDGYDQMPVNDLVDHLISEAG